MRKKSLLIQQTLRLGNNQLVEFDTGVCKGCKPTTSKILKINTVIIGG